MCVKIAKNQYINLFAGMRIGYTKSMNYERKNTTYSVRHYAREQKRCAISSDTCGIGHQLLVRRTNRKISWLCGICRDILARRIDSAIMQQRNNLIKQAKALKKGNINMDTEIVKEQPSRSLALAQKGVESGVDFARLMSALMSDVIEGAITPDIANATVNAGGKLLKVVEMQYKYAPPKAGEQPMLLLAPPENAIS
jgi:hypothetical protein